jgi:hypothetical protein
MLENLPKTIRIKIKDKDKDGIRIKRTKKQG